MNLSNSEKKNYWKKTIFFESFLQKILLHNRIKILKIFQRVIKVKKNYKILDVGASPLDIESENLFLKKFKNHKYFTCLSNQNLDSIKNKFKNFSFLIGDGRNMKFKKNSFDIVYSSATIEHIGNDIMQKKFIAECLRVSRKFIFITTPNKYYPIDFHTKIPLLHWLPHRIYTKVLKLMGDDFFRHKKNLNLISTRKVHDYCKDLDIASYKIFYNNFLFMRSNIVLFIIKEKKN